jgi:hypothetical protein
VYDEDTQASLHPAPASSPDHHHNAITISPRRMF